MDFTRSILRRLADVIFEYGGKSPARQAQAIVRMVVIFFEEFFQLTPELRKCEDAIAREMKDTWVNAECALPPAGEEDEKGLQRVSQAARNVLTLLQRLKPPDERRTILWVILRNCEHELRQLRPRLRRDRDRIVDRLLRNFRTIRLMGGRT